jgi:hypothetical protein
MSGNLLRSLVPTVNSRAGRSVFSIVADNIEIDFFAFASLGTHYFQWLKQSRIQEYKKPRPTIRALFYALYAQALKVSALPWRKKLLTADIQCHAENHLGLC